MRKFLVLIICLSLCGKAIAAPIDVEREMSQLESVIGGFPPHIESPQQLKEVKAKYTRLKQHLDEKLTVSPGDITLLQHRALLQMFGHNMDVEGAFDGAVVDYQHILKLAPQNEEALLGLGEIYVNSNPALAPKAEALFHEAQKAHGQPLLERAQVGLFFASYYQGKMKEASAQAALLHASWPEQEGYAQFVDMMRNLHSPKKPAAPK